MHLPALVDRDIFPSHKTLIREVKPDCIRFGIVVEYPAATLTVNATTVLILLIRPQSRDPACLAMLPPERRIDPVVSVERRDNEIGNAGIALGVTRLACKLDTDLPKLDG